MQRTMLKCPIVHAHCTNAHLFKILKKNKKDQFLYMLRAMHHFRMGPEEFYQFLKRCPITTHEYLLNLMG